MDSWVSLEQAIIVLLITNKSIGRRICQAGIASGFDVTSLS